MRRSHQSSSSTPSIPSSTNQALNPRGTKNWGRWAPHKRFTVGASRTRDDWYRAVERALAAIAGGELEKVVLAREVFVEADRPFDFAAVLVRLVAQQPGCYVHAAGGLIGASPELLARRTGTVVESHPLAGTSPAESDEALRAG